MMDDSSNGFRIVDRSGKAEDSISCKVPRHYVLLYLRYHNNTESPIQLDAEHFIFSTHLSSSWFPNLLSQSTLFSSSNMYTQLQFRVGAESGRMNERGMA